MGATAASIAMGATAANIAETKKKEIPIPEGKVLLDGKLVDRTKVGFLLQQHPVQKEFFMATDSIVYHRAANGQLRNITKKKLTKADKKAEKRDRKKTKILSA